MEDILEVLELDAAANANQLARHFAFEHAGQQYGVAFLDDEGAGIIGDEIEEEVIIFYVELLCERVGLEWGIEIEAR